MKSTLKTSIACLLFSTSLFGQSIEFRTFDVASSGVRGILNNGDALMVGYTYNYETNVLTPKDNGVTTQAHMNANGDKVGTITIDGIVHPAYKLANATEWVVVPVFDNFELGDNTTVYSISNNGRYIVGQMKTVPFIYDIENQELTNLLPEGYMYGAGYSVNNDGTAVGWIDAAINGTFRELGVMQKDQPLRKLLTDIVMPVNNHIWHVDDNGFVVGEVGLKPFSYNLNTNEYRIYDLPAGYRTGSFQSSSNGIIVGYAQNMVMDRDAIIYHESFGNQPKLIKDLLIEQGIEITIPGGKLGGANAISENGQFIGGNEVGNGNIAPGWILNLNSYFESNGCRIQVPSDIEVQVNLGETSAIVNYEVTTDCADTQLVMVSGIASGEAFPIGMTTIAYNAVDQEGNVVGSASFKVNVKDSYCTPRFAAIVEPITKVEFGSIQNNTTSYVTASENEYFLEQSTDVIKGETYTITVAGNTNGIAETSQFVVFFDFDQDGIFNPDTEGYYIGSITGSTGVDGQTVSNQITIPTDILTGPTRMRVMKTYRLVPENPCSLTYAYGQSEDYTINVVENLGSNDIANQSIKVYPNPVKDVVNLQTSKEVKTIAIYNLAGQKIISKEVNIINPSLNVSSLPKGVYILKVETNEGSISHKIIKE
ncbi:MAG TPA: T9SS type A sorting domain-containing protein [Faecalibacter sp.]